MSKIWSREETIIALNLYCKIPFGKLSSRNETIKKHAKVLGRTTDSLVMKMCNIARLDPELQRRGVKGLSQGAKMEEIVWNEFIDNPELLAYQSELLLAKLKKERIEDIIKTNPTYLPEGEERETIIRQRVGQNFFRTVVITSYNYTCCITGLKNEHLVEACHISDWASDIKNRTNPQNGLCMSSMFHTAYDRKLMSVTPDYNIVISDEMIESATKPDLKDYLNSLNNRQIILPERFVPSPSLLENNYEIFIKNR